MKNFKLTPRCSRAGAVLYFVIAAVIFALDQLSKAAVVKNIPFGGSVEFIPWLLRFTYVRNTGAAWSILSGSTPLLAAFSALAVLGISVYGLCAGLCPAARVAVFAVVGGAAGNLVDRVRLGYVVDMIELTFMDYPVFNVADSFIVVGGIAFVLIFALWNDKYLKAHDLPHTEAAPEEQPNDDEAQS